MKYQRYVIFILKLALFLIFYIQTSSSIKQKSVTIQEIYQLPTGYHFLKTKDFIYDIETPPIVKMINAVPVSQLKGLELPELKRKAKYNNKWSFGEEFFYKNKVDAETILSRGRCTTVVLGLLLGILVSHWAASFYGSWAGLFALFLYVFCPNILAHSSLATIDIGASFFILLALFTFWEMLNDPNTFTMLFAGLVFGMALLSKFNAIGLLVIFIIFLILFEAKDFYPSEKIGYISGVILLAAVTVVFVYRYPNCKLYIEGLVQSFRESNMGHPSFLWGRYSYYGWKDYFIRAFLIKTPPLLLLLIGLRIFFNKNIKINGKEYVILLPIAIQFLAASLSKKQMGLHQILIVYPLIFIWVSGVVQLHFYRKLLTAAAIIFVIAGYAVSSIRISPHYLTYFNFLVGGSEKGYKYLTDYNLDLGQDLRELAAYVKEEQVDSLILSYYGVGSVEYYNIQYQDIGSTNYSGYRRSRINPLSPKKELLAVSATNLKAVYFSKKDLFSILMYYKPVKKLGNSIFIYDVTDDMQIHSWLGHTYLSYSRYDEAVREGHRMTEISPKEDVGYLFLGKVYEEMGEIESAQKEYLNALKINPKAFIAKGRLKALGREITGGD